MKILIDIGHPAHVHFFKNFIWEMEKKGHKVLITARDKEIALNLLKKYNINFTRVGTQQSGKYHLLCEWIGRDFKILTIARAFQPDILLGIGNPAIAHVAAMCRKPSIIFTDTEHATFSNSITFPFARIICTPTCYTKNIGPKQVRYQGYHELAYLHPNYFTPNPAVLTELGLKEGDPFIIVRFVSWQASHDVGHHGILDKSGLVKKLEEYGRVFITSECDLPNELKSYRIKASPEKIHDLLYYALLYFGDSPTMTSESVLLGTPGICVSSWACNLGYLKDLSSKYDLLFCYNNEDIALNKAIDLLKTNNIKEAWKTKREKMLKDKIDVTMFMVTFIEEYFL